LCDQVELIEIIEEMVTEYLIGAEDED